MYSEYYKMAQMKIFPKYSCCMQTNIQRNEDFIHIIIIIIAPQY